MNLSENSIVGFVLNILNDKVSSVVNGDREIIDLFIKQVSDNLPRYTDYGDNFTLSFSHGGSSYEGLAVSEEADINITVLLGRPFELCNFDVERDEQSKFFTLRWKSHIKRKIFCDYAGYIDTAKLRVSVFGRLTRAIQRFYIPGTEITVKEGLAALVITIKRRTGRTISVDFVPQFVFRSWDQCPNLLPLSVMPPDLRRYIDTLNTNRSPAMCLSLAVPHKERYRNNNRLLNISFSLLEKEFFQKNTEIRDMVRLVKFVAHRRGWKENFGFKSYFAKRVAIKNDSQLGNKNLWEGYLSLLLYLRDELKQNGTFDGFFVDEQVTYLRDRTVAPAFIRDINAVLRIPAKKLVDLA